MSIITSVHIQTMSLRGQNESLSIDDKQEQDTKLLRVDLSGQIQIQPTDRIKLLELDARKIETQIDNLIDGTLLWRGDILMRVTRFPDDFSSAGFTDKLVESIHRIFCSMFDCFNIIINCRHGRNRAVMMSARLASLIHHGSNGPSVEAYHYYQHICQSISPGYDVENCNTWPQLCTNDFVQTAIFLPNRRVGGLYPGTSKGFRVENPLGSIQCTYQYNPEKLKEEIMLARAVATQRNKISN